MRRALEESLSDSGFGSLVARGLERQADVALAWRGHYGSLLQVAYSQRRLSEADFRRYASEFFHLEVGATYHDMSSWPEANRLPPVSLELRGQHRGGSHREVDGKPVPTIPVFAMVYVRDIALDDAPVAMLEAEEPRPEIVLFHAGSGAGTAAGRNIRLATEDSLPPGAHVLTGRVEIVVKRGAHSWREGANEEAPVILSRQEAFRVTFEVPSR